MSDPKRAPPSRDRAARRRVLSGALLMLTAMSLPVLAPADEASTVTGLQSAVVFTEGGPLSQSSDILQRLLSPLASKAVRERLATAGKTLADQAIVPAQERFVLYVPPRAPPGGYGVMVFVPPWEEARLPAEWGPVLDDMGMIYVSAARSGNTEDVLGRRVALALFALENVRRRYPVNSERVYVGGFSGGSRVALRLALDYPDIFRGALLNAGSDPIGAAPDHFPSQDLLAQFQDRSRLVYITGELDDARLAMDAASRASMRKACVFNVDARVTSGAHHEVAGASALSQALRSLAARTPVEPARLAACRLALEGELNQDLQRATALIASGQKDAARRQILTLDARFAGLAGPRILDLARTCGCQVLP
jgi:predicted esterase